MLAARAPGVAAGGTTPAPARRVGRGAPEVLRRSAAGSAQQQGAVQQAGVDYFATDRRPVVLFDGVCNLCNGAVTFMLDVDGSAAFRLAALQSPAGKALLQRSGRSREDISSIVLVEENGHYIRSEAILRIASGLSNPFPFLALFGFPVPTFLRDAFYDQVANNRYSIFGRTTSCRMMDESYKGRFIVE